MKTNKVFKWLYGVFMFLPMLAIGVTCLYVTFNKNAKDSYYGENINEVIYHEVNSVDDIKVNQRYNFNIPLVTTPNTSASSTFYIENVSNLSTNYSTTIDETTITGFYIAYNSGLTANVFTIYRDNLSTIYINLAQNYVSLDFDLVSTNGFAQWDYYNQYLSTMTYNKNSYLDNAFYYAVDQFNESGFNKVDFVSFFDMFYNNTNIWTTFANTYFNYMLFVSLAFFIPRVLLWFINLAFAYSDGFERKSQRW